MVFTNSRILGQRVAHLLEQLGFPAQFVCGDLPQEQRLAAIARLRAFELRVLVSSDLTARGIDVERINLVVNLELPPSYDTYLHRVGRTGRFGRYGVAVTLVEGPIERKKITDMGDELLVDIQPKPDTIPPELFSMEDVEEEEETLRFRELALKRQTAVDQQTDPASLIATLTHDRAKSQGEAAGGKVSAPAACNGGGRGEKKGVGGGGGTWARPPLEGGLTWQESEAALWGSEGPFGDKGGRGAGEGARIGGYDVSAGGGRDLGLLTRGVDVLVRVQRSRQGEGERSGGSLDVKMCKGAILGGGSAPGLFWVELDSAQEKDSVCKWGQEHRRTEVDVEDIWRLGVGGGADRAGKGQGEDGASGNAWRQDMDRGGGGGGGTPPWSCSAPLAPPLHTQHRPHTDASASPTPPPWFLEYLEASGGELPPPNFVPPSFPPQYVVNDSHVGGRELGVGGGREGCGGGEDLEAQMPMPPRHLDPHMFPPPPAPVYHPLLHPPHPHPPYPHPHPPPRPPWNAHPSPWD